MSHFADLNSLLQGIDNEKESESRVTDIERSACNYIDLDQIDPSTIQSNLFDRLLCAFAHRETANRIMKDALRHHEADMARLALPLRATIHEITGGIKTA